VLHSYIWPSIIPLYGWTTLSLLIHKLVHIWILLLWTFVHKFLWVHVFSPLGYVPRAGVGGSCVVLDLTFWVLGRLFSQSISFPLLAVCLIGIPPFLVFPGLLVHVPSTHRRPSPLTIQHRPWGIGCSPAASTLSLQCALFTIISYWVGLSPAMSPAGIILPDSMARESRHLTASDSNSSLPGYLTTGEKKEIF
jgi:hypothetical protein